MSGEDRFDGLFLNVAQQAQGIEPLLDHFFGFLRRKTDFFNGADNATVEDLVMKTVRKHSALSAKDRQNKAVMREKEEKRKQARLEKKKQDELALKQKQESEKATAMANMAKAAVKAAPEPDDEGVMELNDDGTFDTSSSSSSSAPATKEPSLSDSTAAEGNKDEEEEDNTPAPLGNGGSTDVYTWTQTLSELNVVIDLPRGISTKQFTVDIKNRKLKVYMKATPDKPLVDGDFFNRVIVDDCCWTLEDGHELCISLAKENKMEWWKCVIKGDAEINTQKVQPENSKLNDLDGETRQTVEKMMYDQRQKAQGKPTSDEESKQNMMNKFMKAHPEMDFSKAKFS